MVTRLVLVRHAEVAVDRSVPASQWALAPNAYPALAQLTSQDAFQGPVAFVSSSEPKAAQTARSLAGSRQVVIERGLAELDRSSATWLPEPEAYATRVANIFARPSVSIDGCESADAALARFERAVNRQLNLCSVPVLAVVSHGIVLTLYLASQLGKAPDFSLWQALRMPDYAVIDLHPWQMIKPFGEPQPATVVPA